jgi:hypothetical protein
MAVEGLALLADFAEVVNGKLYVMGGGWTDVVLLRPQTFALATRIEVPYDRTNEQLLVEARLTDSDGKVVVLGGNEIVIQNQIEVGRPPGIKAGQPIAVPLAWTFQGLTLSAGRYAFLVLVNADEVARAAFNVHVPPQPSAPSPTDF